MLTDLAACFDCLQTHFPLLLDTCLHKSKDECANALLSYERFGCKQPSRYATHPIRLASGWWKASPRTCHSSVFVDGSPESLHLRPETLRALHALWPTTRFFALLRHPPSRDWSDYLFTWRREVATKCTGKGREDVIVFRNVPYRCGAGESPGGVALSFQQTISTGAYPTKAYLPQLEKHSVPILVLRLEDWKQHPKAFSDRVAQHLGSLPRLPKPLRYVHTDVRAPSAGRGALVLTASSPPPSPPRAARVCTQDAPQQ